MAKCVLETVFCISSENIVFSEKIVNTEHLICDKKCHIHFWGKIIYLKLHDCSILRKFSQILINYLEIEFNFNNN